jgi:hypothetical protein
MGNKDDERFWNLLVYKMYATDEEIAEMMPFLLGLLVLIGIGFGIYHLIT